MNSQNQEEQYILEALQGQETGSFLDIGAYDGFTFSNTWALAQKGWSGVLFEPGLRAFQALLKHHGDNPSLTLVHGAVSRTGQGFSNFSNFWDSADGVSTTEQEWEEKWKGVAGYSRPFVIYTIPLLRVLMRWGHFDFINIDTEGTSIGLFESLIEYMHPALRGGFHFDPPKVICVEFDDQQERCLALAQERGYRMTYMSSENMVLVREGK